MFWPFKSFLQAEVLCISEHDSSTTHLACNPVSLDRGQEMQRSFSLALGHAVIIVSSKFKGQGCIHSLIIYFVCAYIFAVNRVFHSRGLSPGPPLLMFPGSSSSLSNQPVWTKRKYLWAPTQNQRHRSLQNFVKTGRSLPEERKCIICEGWS